MGFLNIFTIYIKHNYDILTAYEGGSESSVIGVITLLINIIGCCIIP